MITTVSHVDYPDIVGTLVAVIGPLLLVRWHGLATYQLVHPVRVKRLVEVRS